MTPLMSHAWHHAVSSARRYGGIPEDYVKIHEWFDAPKEHIPDFRSRMFRHHTQGITVATQVFGPVITNSDGKEIPVQWIGEQHLIEDFGRLIDPAEWVVLLNTEPWMAREAISGPKKSPSLKETRCQDSYVGPYGPEYKPASFN